MAVTTALMVAQWFVLDAARNAKKGNGDYMTQLRVQKLLFFSQGTYMVLNNGEKLFDDKIYHETYGPVVVDLSPYLKKYKSSPITSILDLNNEPVKIDFGDKKQNIEKVLRFVQKGFGQFSTFQLVKMTHDDPSWKDTGSGEEIRPSDIKKSAEKLYFKDV